jgi:hypothetical protein
MTEFDGLASPSVIGLDHASEHFVTNKQALAARLGGAGAGAGAGSWSGWGAPSGLESPGLAALTAASELHGYLDAPGAQHQHPHQHPAPRGRGGRGMSASLLRGGLNGAGTSNLFDPPEEGAEAGSGGGTGLGIDDEGYGGRQALSFAASASGAFSPSSSHRRKRGDDDAATAGGDVAGAVGALMLPRGARRSGGSSSGEDGAGAGGRAKRGSAKQRSNSADSADSRDSGVEAQCRTRCILSPPLAAPP